MGCEVYANGDEVACKAGDGKVIAAFPDVCLTPPTPPAGPIPVPYPDTSFSRDMKEGSTTVRIKGKEVMLKDTSYYKSSPLGNEAATRNLGAGVVTHVITGKTYFVSWSMDVKFEGKNVDRHTDLTTSNHASPMANNQVPMGNMAFMAPPGPPLAGACKCCGNTHAGQQGGVAVTEDEWYGLNEGPELQDQLKALSDNEPHKLHKSARKRSDAAFDDLVTRQNKLDQRRAAVAKARASKCAHLPKPPCDTYYVFPQDPADTAAGRVTAIVRSQQNDAEFAAESDNLRRTNPRFKAGETIHHNVGKAAGGCPTGNGNLTPDSELSQECKDIEKDLKKAQDSAFERWVGNLAANP